MNNWKKKKFSKVKKCTNSFTEYRFSELISDAIRLDINRTDSIEFNLEKPIRTNKKQKSKLENKKSKVIRLKAIKIVLSIVFLFFIQWTPLWVFEIYKLDNSSSIEDSHLVNSIVSLVSYSNSISNPLLYILITVSFQNFLLEIYRFIGSKCFKFK